MTAGLRTGLTPDPPLPFRLTSSQVLELREGGSIGIALLGLPFFLAGCSLSFNVLRALFLGAGLRGGGSLVAGGGMGVAFTFGRRWLVLDIGRGLLIRHFGLLVPMRADYLSAFLPTE